MDAVEEYVAAAVQHVVLDVAVPRLSGILDYDTQTDVWETLINVTIKNSPSRHFRVKVTEEYL